MRLYQVEYTESSGDMTEAWYRNRRDALASGREETRTALGVGGKAEVFECYTEDAPAGEMVLRALNRTDDFIRSRELIAHFECRHCGKCDECKKQEPCSKPRAIKIEQEQAA